MRSLIRSELLRISSRRVARVLALLALVAIAIGVTIAAIKSNRPSAAQLALQRTRYERDLQRCLSGRLGAPDQLPPGTTLAGFCRTIIRPENYDRGSALHLTSLPNTLKGSAFAVIVVGLIIGASSVGAEWQHGTIATLLTWEPRRVRVLVTRAAVVTITVTILALALLIVLALGLAAVAALRGTTDGAWLRETAGTVLRIAVTAGVASALGLAIATIGRNTAAALGAVFVYLAIVESLLRSLIPRLTPWMLGPNLVVFVVGRPGNPGTSTISVAQAALTLAIYAIGLFILALAFFRERDVT